MFALAVALVVLSGQTSPLDVKVRYENAGASAVRVLADLSRLSDIHLEAAPETADEILCVRTQDDSLRVLMDRIAWAVDGEWKSVGDGYRLIRTAAQQQAEEKQERERLIAGLAVELAKKREALNGVGEFEEADARKLAEDLAQPRQQTDPKLLELMSKRPLRRLTARLVAAADPLDLADVPDESSVVYSNRPNKMQRPFNRGMANAVQDFLQEQPLWNKAMEAKGIANNKALRSDYSFEPPSAGSVDKILLIFERNVSLDLNEVSFFVQVCFANQAGEIVGRDESYLDGNRRLFSCPRGPDIFASDDTRIDIPGPNDFESALLAGGSPNSPRYRRELAYPETHEPLSYLSGRALIASAKAASRSLVADLTDAAFFVDAVPVANWFMRSLSRWYEQNPSDDWIGLRPPMLASARAGRANRAAFGRFLRQYQQNWYVPLEERVRLCTELPVSPSPGMSFGTGIPVEPMSWWLLGLLNNGEHDFPYWGHDLEFYGMLTTRQKRIAESGGLRVDALNPQQRRLLELIVSCPEYECSGWKIKTLTGWQNADSGWPYYRPGTNSRLLYGEPTECLPNGIQGDALIHLTLTKTTCLAQDKVSYERMHQVWTAKLAAQRLYTDIRAGHESNISRKFQLGTQTTCQLRFDFTPTTALELNVTGEEVGPKWFSYNQLPVGFRRDVQIEAAKIDAMNKAYNNRAYQKPGAPPP